MISDNCNKKERILRLETMKNSLVSRYGSKHFAIKALENRIFKVRYFWWMGV